MVSGVQFPADGETGARSSTGPAKAIWSAAFESMAPPVALQKLSDKVVTCRSLIESERNWRRKYGSVIGALSREAVKSPETTLRIAQDGLKASHELFRFVRGGEETSLAEAMRAEPDAEAPPTLSGVVRSSGTREVDVTAATAVPIGSESFSGPALVGRVADMVKSGHAEPDVLAAIKDLVPNLPAYRESLADTYFVLLGATSELCPLDVLLELGLNVVGIARPNAKRQAGLIEKARAAPAGATLTLPVLKAVEGGEEALADLDVLAGAAGADLLESAPEVARWLAALYPGKRLVVGSYVYLDGANHVRASMAMDAVVQSVVEQRPDTALMYLGTPAVLYPIPKEAADDSALRRRNVPLWNHVAGAVLGPYKPNVLPPVKADHVNAAAADQSKLIYMYDGIINVQGPNYLLAKTIQNWRAMVTRDVHGCVVSNNITPTCSTDSVMHVPAVAAAVKGMKAFPPLTSFEPATARVLMALLVLYDLCDPASTANPDVALRNPLEIFSTLGVHGGLWRAPYSNESLGKSAFALGKLGLY